jgi:hypothetical protein
MFKAALQYLLDSCSSAVEQILKRCHRVRQDGAARKSIPDSPGEVEERSLASGGTMKRGMSGLTGRGDEGEDVGGSEQRQILSEIDREISPEEADLIASKGKGGTDIDGFDSFSRMF